MPGIAMLVWIAEFWVEAKQWWFYTSCKQ